MSQILATEFVVFIRDIYGICVKDFSLSSARRASIHPDASIHTLSVKARHPFIRFIIRWRLSP